MADVLGFPRASSIFGLVITSYAIIYLILGKSFRVNIFRIFIIFPFLEFRCGAHKNYKGVSFRIRSYYSKRLRKKEIIKN